ncbi:MAG TPA: AI-2E family transporter [Planctomycetota bacterium]|jgi:predicted PurR-regulated permease PerM
MPRSAPSFSGGIYSLAAVFIVVAALYFASPVLIIVALSVLFSFLLAPVVSWMERWLGRVLSTIVVVVLALSILGGAAYVVVDQFVRFVAKIPESQATIEHKLQSISFGGGSIGRAQKSVEQLGQQLSGSAQAQNKAGADSPQNAPRSTENTAQRQTAGTPSGLPVPVEVVQAPPNALQLFRTALGPLLGPLGNALMVTVLVFFMLLQREDLRNRFVHMMGPRMNVTTQALDEAGHRVSSYLLSNFIVNTGYGVLIGTGVFLIGIPSAFLCGLLATLLRFIPYIGVWIAAALPILLSITIEGWWHTFAVMGLFAFVEVLVVNFVEPYVYGRSTGVGLVPLLLSAVFWTWLWGGVGLFLSIPLTVCVVVLGKYVPQLHFLAAVLGDEEVMPTYMLLYQRLLAKDYDEAADLLSEAFQGNDVVDVYDSTLLPALVMAERDRHYGRIDEQKAAEVRALISALNVDLLAESESDQTAESDAKRGAPPRWVPASPESGTIAICTPAQDAADEVCSHIFSQLLALHGVLATTLTPAEVERHLQKKDWPHARALIISALPPTNRHQLRRIYEAARRSNPDALILVGFWTSSWDAAGFERYRQRLRSDTNVQLVGTFAVALKQLRALLASPPQQSRSASARTQAKPATTPPQSVPAPSLPRPSTRRP